MKGKLKMIINNKNYTIPELNFNTICTLEEMGISLDVYKRQDFIRA